MKTEKTTPAQVAKESNTLVTVTEVAEQVGREILESRLEPGAWATALYECGGKRQDALALYARLRAPQADQTTPHPPRENPLLRIPPPHQVHGRQGYP